MYCVLKDDIALRSWRMVPFAYLKKGYNTAKSLSEKEFSLLLKCDGVTDLENEALIENMIRRELIIPCEKGEKKLSKWQEYRDCDNRYMPQLDLQITGRCNYNCLHCFNCKDNAPLQSEMSFEQIVHLLDECVECGVTSFVVTGGEPFLHPHFKEILDAIYSRNLSVFELNTNGYYVDDAILDHMLSIDCRPCIKISFDGLGYHDWMRRFEGAEKIALDAIRRCQAKGFDVHVQMNANRYNKDSIYPSLCLLDEMGVQEVRLIKTTDAPRWQQNANGLDFDWREYYDFLAELFCKYAHEEHHLALDVWQVLYYDPKGHYYNIDALYHNDTDKEALICSDGRRMAAVASDGEVYGCMQMQGFMKERGISFGNVFKDGLQQLLQESRLLDLVCLCLEDKLVHNEECRQCRFLKYCHGGCPALAMLTNGRDITHYFAPDRTKCIMLKEDYYKKISDAFGEENEDISTALDQ